MHSEHLGPLNTSLLLMSLDNDEEKEYPFFTWFLLCFILGSLALNPVYFLPPFP